MHQTLSFRSRIRAWSFYAALAYTAVTVTVVGVSIEGLAHRAGLGSPYELHNIFIGRLFGSLLGTLTGGALLDFLPVKLVMGICMATSAMSLFAIPYFASLGPQMLIANFALLGFSGSALVTSATTTACWAFPGEKVAPINSGMAASFGVTGALLPVLLLLAHGVLDIQYMLSVALVLPAMILFLVSDAPSKPDPTKFKRFSVNTETKLECMNWLMAMAASVSQLLLQGAYTSLVVWLPTFGKERINSLHANAALLVTVLQGSVTLGALVAMHYQKRFELSNLACGQLLLVVVNLIVWSFDSYSTILGFCAVTIFGFFGGSTLGYPSSLFNKYTRTPSGKQFSLITLGGNAGTSLGPFFTGLVMSLFGPSALIFCALSANAIVLLGMISLRNTFASRAEARELNANSETSAVVRLLRADEA